MPIKLRGYLGLIIIFITSACSESHSSEEMFFIEMKSLYEDEKKPAWYRAFILSKKEKMGAELWHTSSDELNNLHNSNIQSICNDLGKEIGISESLKGSLYFSEFSAIETRYVAGGLEAFNGYDGLSHVLLANPHLEMSQDFEIIFRADTSRDDVAKRIGNTVDTFNKKYFNQQKASDPEFKNKFYTWSRCMCLNIFMAMYGFETEASKFA